MFTGIIQDVGTVTTLVRGNEVAEITITTALAPTLTPGGSIAVNGACLTAQHVSSDSFSSSLMPSTLGNTALGDLSEGARVNLEPSLRVGDELGGHFVFGHVDCVGEITAYEKAGTTHILTIQAPRDFISASVVPRGSVAIDGTSLTVVEATDATFTVSLVSYTLDHTIAGAYTHGTRVNLECDMLARYAHHRAAVS